MATAPKYSYAAVNAGQNAISDLLDGGYLRIYASGSTPPTNADDAVAGTLLAELTLNATFSGNSSSGTITANSITADSAANATGTADYFRLWKSDGTTCIFQGTVGTSNCDLNLNSTAIQTNAAVSVTSLAITLPRA